MTNITYFEYHCFKVVIFALLHCRILWLNNLQTCVIEKVFVIKRFSSALDYWQWIYDSLQKFLFWMQIGFLTFFKNLTLYCQSNQGTSHLEQFFYFIIILINKEYFNIVKVSFAIFNVTLSMLLTMWSWNQQLRCKLARCFFNCSMCYIFLFVWLFLYKYFRKGLRSCSWNYPILLGCPVPLCCRACFKRVVQSNIWRHVMEKTYWT